MRVYEKELQLPAIAKGADLLRHFRRHVEASVGPGLRPIRVVISATTESGYTCEVGVLAGAEPVGGSIFDFRPRRTENQEDFNVALVVPTGIGAEIGGHAGDAGPAARLLAQLCDRLITHPNVVNASDLNEVPENGLYVEGSVLSRLLMGTAGLQPVRSNRVLLVIDRHSDPTFSNAAINAANAAASAYGLRVASVVTLDPPVKLRATYAPSGRAAGHIDDLEPLMQLLTVRRDDYDAVAISSVIDVPRSFHSEYFACGGEMVNPWGGVEAMLTHSVSEVLDVPSAHAPMFESQEIANADPGVVDARMAAEAISVTFVQCVLKGLRASPRIVKLNAQPPNGLITAADVSALVIPDGCIGLPTLAALKQRIPVVAVRESRNVMRNELSQLPWADGCFYCVDNYLEAAGVLACLRAGVDPRSVRRPLASVAVDSYTATESPEGRMENRRRGSAARAGG